MYCRIGAEYKRRSRAANKAALRKIVRQGPPPGLIAFVEDLAVAWCQLTPRDAVPWLDRTWRLARVDELPVWSLSCLYVRLGHRRRGIATALIKEALGVARRAEAPALEAYPFDAELSPSSSSTGYASTFARLGFKVVARRIPARPIMRHDLKDII
jgi:GNAT superfamily N-acetyltransferase